MNKFSQFFLILFSLFSCSNSKVKNEYQQLEVTATAFNSISWQTDESQPSIAAWGDTLKPGMKAIAISRDLIDSGLVHNTKVIVEELEDTFLVKDKMNKRWLKKIDVYMGKDIKEAREFGRKKVTIKWKK